MMADYTVISDSQVDPDAPLTSGLAYAWRDNTIAIAEGASGAPRVVGKALSTDQGTVTILTGASYDFIGLDGAGFLEVWLDVNTASAGVTIRFSNDNGATFGSSQNLAVVLADYVGIARFSIVTGVGISNLGALAFTVPSNCNAIRIRNPSANTVVANLQVAGGI